MSKASETLLEPIFQRNPIGAQMLGICSALAVTTKLSTSLTMCAAVTFVLVCSNAFLSLIRWFVPSSIRMIVQMTIIASLVIVVDQFLKAFAYDLSKQLSVYVGLIITNCIIMGRAEAFAMKKRCRPEHSRRAGKRHRLQLRPPGRRRSSRTDRRRNTPRLHRPAHHSRRRMVHHERAVPAFAECLLPDWLSDLGVGVSSPDLIGERTLKCSNTT